MKSIRFLNEDYHIRKIPAVGKVVIVEYSEEMHLLARFADFNPKNFLYNYSTHYDGRVNITWDETKEVIIHFSSPYTGHYCFRGVFKDGDIIRINSLGYAANYPWECRLHLLYEDYIYRIIVDLVNFEFKLIEPIPSEYKHYVYTQLRNNLPGCNKLTLYSIPEYYKFNIKYGVKDKKYGIESFDDNYGNHWNNTMKNMDYMIYFSIFEVVELKNITYEHGDFHFRKFKLL